MHSTLHLSIMLLRACTLGLLSDMERCIGQPSSQPDLSAAPQALVLVLLLPAVLAGKLFWTTSASQKALCWSWPGRRAAGRCIRARQATLRRMQLLACRVNGSPLREGGYEVQAAYGPFQAHECAVQAVAALATVAVGCVTEMVVAPVDGQDAGRSFAGTEVVQARVTGAGGLGLGSGSEIGHPDLAPGVSAGACRRRRVLRMPACSSSWGCGTSGPGPDTSRPVPGASSAHGVDRTGA